MRVYTQEQKARRRERDAKRHAERRAAGWVRKRKPKGPVKGPAWADTQPGNRGPEWMMTLTREEIVEARRCDDKIMVGFHRERSDDWKRYV